MKKQLHLITILMLVTFFAVDLNAMWGAPRGQQQAASAELRRKMQGSQPKKVVAKTTSSNEQIAASKILSPVWGKPITEMNAEQLKALKALRESVRKQGKPLVGPWKDVADSELDKEIDKRLHPLIMDEGFVKYQAPQPQSKTIRPGMQVNPNKPPKGAGWL